MESIIQKALRLLLDKFDAEYDCVTVTEENGYYRANIETPDPSKLIGKNGVILQALQVVLKNILWTQTSENVFVSVDIDNYKKVQEDKVIERAQKSIDTMKSQNLSEIKLPPMSPYFRRVIHLWVAATLPEFGSDSVGQDRARAVRIFYK